MLMSKRQSISHFFFKDQRVIWSRGLVLGFMLILSFNHSQAQAQAQAKTTINYTTTQDSIYKYFPNHSPSKATWMSAALPGLGQYYNQMYWKIPIIYAGFSTLIFFVAENKYQYNRFKDAYAISMEIPDGQTSSNYLVTTYTSEQLLSQRDYYQSSLEMSYILTGVFYILQIVDAAVDANLYGYDIDDDLSIQIQPQWVPTEAGVRMAPGIGLSWKLGVE